MTHEPLDGSGGTKAGKKTRVKLVGHDARTAYGALPGYRLKFGIVSKTVDLKELLEYQGPRVHLDLDKEGRLIGIEILVGSGR